MDNRGINSVSIGIGIYIGSTQNLDAMEISATTKNFSRIKFWIPDEFWNALRKIGPKVGLPL